VALQGYESLERSGTGGGPGELGERLIWAEKADQLAQPGTLQRIYADIYLGSASMGRSREFAHACLRRALEQAKESTDNGAFFAAAGWVLSNLLAIRDRELSTRTAYDVLGRPRDGVRTRDLAIALRAAAGILISSGDRETAEQAWHELEVLADRTGDATVKIRAMEPLIFRTFAAGRIEEALALYTEYVSSGRELGIGAQMGAGGITLFLEVRMLEMLGRPLEPILPLIQGPSRPARSLRALTLAILNRSDEARAIVKEFGDIGSEDDESAWGILSTLLETAQLSGDSNTVRVLLPRLSLVPRAMVGLWGGSAGRLLARGASLLDMPREARAYAETGLDFANRVSTRPEVALCHLDLAELLLEHYPAERHAAIEHLDFAISEFQDMKMQPALERALRHRGLLKA
jgi:hypothetical protein